MVVGEGQEAPSAASRWTEADRLIADTERLHGPLRIFVRRTDDGLGVHIPPQRSIAVLLFLSVWLCGWAAGEHFAYREIAGSGFRLPGILILVWAVPWTAGGLAVVWVVLWQLFGRESLFFTAGALVREWSLLWQNRRRVVMGSDILSVKADGPGGDLWGLGTIKVRIANGRQMRIGSGLDVKEAELVAALIEEHARSGSPAAGPDD